MVGGMIPPLAIATAMIFFKRKFTKEQRGSIVPNYVMGLSFITEVQFHLLQLTHYV